MKRRITTTADRAGIASAALCTVHCLVVPAMLLLKVSIGGHEGFQPPVWWPSLDYVFLLVSFLAVYHAARHTIFSGIKAALWVFWAMLTVAILFEATLHWLAYIASAGLISAHFTNIWKMRKATVQPHSRG